MDTIFCKGVIFDLDGVITDTAHLHASAWEIMFNEYLKAAAQRDGKPFLPFDRKDDYENFVDGKPRMEGVKSFLESRGIHLDFGEMEDATDKETVCGLGNRKNELFKELLHKEGPRVYDSSVDFIKALHAKGIRTAVASSSRNCKSVLELAGLMDLFAARVDGDVSLERGLKGKPDPDIFVEAARDVGLDPSECVVVEDAISGVQAGRKGNFGLTLGLARTVDGNLLKQFGADLVVSDLSEFSLEDLDEWFEKGVAADGWNLTYHGFDPGDEKLRATLTTVGNGYLGTRGSFAGVSASFSFYPGTYIAGIYNKTPTEVHGRDIYNNDFVNCPNWLLIELKIGSGPFRNPLELELLSYSQKLNMREAILERWFVIRDKLGRITRLHTKRLASMAQPHLCALYYDITPLNYNERITVRSSIDGNVINDGVARYRDLNRHHLDYVASGDTDHAETGIYLHMETSASKYQVVMNAKTRVRENGRILRTTRKVVEDKAKIGEELRFPARENHTYRVEKLVSVYTSQDKGVRDPRPHASKALKPVKSFHTLYRPHVAAWERLWDRADYAITGDRFTQKVIRLHAYHLLVTASPHNTDIDAGMPARGLHGEAYRGHIFWDELYIQPFFDLRFPDIAKALLLYRYHRLDGARAYARENGYKGAMYPWQTADGGEEETQEVHYNPAADNWGPDLSRRQRHVSIAVFYNVWRYVHVTNDKKFLREYGAEMMLEIARFWASIAAFDPADGRYHIEGVMGPDEFHEALPGSDEPGVKDNAYTNIMVVWLMEKALELLETLPAKDKARIQRAIRFKDKETEKWREMVTGMNVIINEDGIISQFDGYFGLDELDWDDYRRRYYSIHRMDRILKAENDSPDHYKVAKQADTLMTFYVLTPGDVSRILEQLGYDTGHPLELLRRNYEYYEQRTSHGSTLSKVVHAVISSYIHKGDDTPWVWFQEAVESDIFDTQGGTTIEGVHTGVMAGTIDVVTRHFAGVQFEDDVLVVQPHLPENWRELAFSVCHRRTWYRLWLSHDAVRVTIDGRGKCAVPVRVNGHTFLLTPGEERKVPMR